MQGDFTPWNQRPDAGARGFNLYDGTFQQASFDAIATSGDGSVDIQVSKELPQLEVRGDLTTSGGTGTSLVQGQQVQLSAIALSIKPGGRIDQATIGGRTRRRFGEARRRSIKAQQRRR
jgi:hypothetical protein